MRPAIVLFACLAGCSRAAPDQAGEVTRLADDYVAAFFERSPESATRLGLPASIG